MNKIFVLILVAMIAGCTSKKMERPNIIVIMANGLGYEDVGVYHSDSVTKTPNLDVLAQKGICFTSGYVPFQNPTFTEYALMTGRYPSKEKYSGSQTDKPFLAIEKGQFTLSKAMKDAGYVTGTIGKLHLDHSCHQNMGFDFLNLQKNEVSMPANNVVVEAIDFISIHKNESYFLYLRSG